MYDRHVFGQKNEELAVHWLEKQGYEIIERNVRYQNSGEIDIVARKNSILVFIEVRSRKNFIFGHPSESIEGPKMMKFLRAVRIYISFRLVRIAGIDEIRLDVITVSEGGFIEHFPGCIENSDMWF